MLFGDGTHDSPIALVDDNDHTNQDQGRSPVKRMKMENGEGLHVPLDRPVASDTIQPADSHSMDSKKRKRSSVSDVVGSLRLILACPPPLIIGVFLACIFSRPGEGVPHITGSHWQGRFYCQE
jgi:hypothetical protein